MKKLLHSLTGAFLAAAALAPQAQAITPEELDGRHCVIRFGGSNVVGASPVNSTSGTFEYHNGNLWIHNFWQDDNGQSYSVPVTLSNNRMTLRNGNYDYEGAKISVNSARLYDNPVYVGYRQYYGSYAKPSSSSMYISSSSANSYFKHNNGLMTWALQSTTNSQGTGTLGNILIGKYGDIPQPYSNIIISLLEENSWAFEFDADDNIQFHYPVDTDLSGNTLTIKDILQCGMNWTYNYSNLASSSSPKVTNLSSEWVKATVKDNSVTIPSRVLQRHMDFSYEYGTQYVYTTQENTIYDFILTGSPNGSSTSISGEVKDGGSTHMCEKLWHSNSGGDLATFTCDNIYEFSDVYVYSTQTSSNVVYVPKYQIWNNFHEVTHDVDIDGVNLDYWYGVKDEGSSDKYIYVSSTILPGDNHDAVAHESYELYIVPGAYSAINSNFTDEGHPHAIRIDNNPDYFTRIVDSNKSKMRAPSVSQSTAEELNEGNNFNLLIPAKDINGGNGNYSLYVKTIYKDPTLEPTFHALTPLRENEITTGIESAFDEETIAISAVAGGIVVEGFEGNVEVYTAAGVQVYAGVADGTISVAPGLYIVKAGSRVEKLNVR